MQLDWSWLKGDRNVYFLPCISKNIDFVIVREEISQTELAIWISQTIYKFCCLLPILLAVYLRYNPWYFFSFPWLLLQFNFLWFLNLSFTYRRLGKSFNLFWLSYYLRKSFNALCELQKQNRLSADMITNNYKLHTLFLDSFNNQIPMKHIWEAIWQSLQNRVRA